MAEKKLLTWQTNKRVTVSFRFQVEIKGIVEAGFNEVSGLQAETELEEYNEGGINEYTHRFPKKIKYPPLVLKRGILRSNELWDWYQGFMMKQIKRMDVTIKLTDENGEAIMNWTLKEAYPIKWVGPTLSASKSEVAIETLEIVHNGIKVT
jgi:phage tail-like protein